MHMQLSDSEYVGLSIYMSMKSSYRRSEMESRGVDYDTVVAQLTERGIIKNKRLDKKLAHEVYTARFGDTLSSQTHQVLHKLGITGHTL